MNENIADITYHFLKDRIPLFASILLIMLFYIPHDFFALNGFYPQTGLMCIYYWLEKRPNLFGYISVFLLGLLMDICSTTPLGINCLTVVIIAFFLYEINRFIKPVSFITEWLFFALTDIIYMLLRWLFVSLYFQQFSDIFYVLPHIFATVSFYPLIAAINNLIRMHLLIQERINE